MATTVTRYVNAGSSAGGDGTTNATSGSTRAYVSLTAALTAEFGATPDLVASDILLKVLLAGTTNESATFASTYTMPAFTTDATRYLHIGLDTTSATQHGGYYNTGVARYSGAVSGAFFAAGTVRGFTVFEDIQFVSTAATGYHTIIGSATGINGVRLERCVLHTTYTGAPGDSSQAAINLTGVNTKDIWLVNCVISGRWATGFRANYGGASSNIVLYNNTIVGCNEFGIDLENTNANRCWVKNNILEGRTGDTADYRSNNGQTTATNMTSDTSSPNNTWDSKLATYNNAGSFDYRLSSSDTNAKDQGTDLSGDSKYVVTTDITNTTRAGTWDIGAYEVVVLSAKFSPFIRGMAGLASRMAEDDYATLSRRAIGGMQMGAFVLLESPLHPLLKFFGLDSRRDEEEESAIRRASRFLFYRPVQDITPAPPATGGGNVRRFWWFRRRHR